MNHHEAILTMKKNYNIKLNPKKISSEEISGFKDFDALLEQFQAQAESPPTPRVLPFRRRFLYIGGAVAAALAGLLLYFIFGIDTGAVYQKEMAQYFENQPFINPPLENVKPQFANFKFNANEGGLYEYESGSRLKVPSAAFVDNAGKVVEGEVDIKYREYHDFVDIFLSGIPMTYDSAGTTYTLESAGMMEIYAEKDGQRVKLAPGKTIDVELVSNVNVPPHLNVPPDYNIYKLDRENRRWDYRNVDKMQLIEEENGAILLDEKDPLYQIKKTYQEQLDAAEISNSNELAQIEATIPKPEEPLKPLKDNGSGVVFSFDISELEDNAAQEYADAKQEATTLSENFSSMLWQINPQSNINPSKLEAPEDGSWDGMRLRKINNRDFELTLIEGTEAIKVLVNPVLGGNDYDRAMADYNAQFDLYEKALQAREERLTAQKQNLEAKITARKAELEKEYQAQLEKYRRQGDNLAATNYMIKRKVVNRFQASEMGIWNCDRPLPPLMVKLKAKFKDRKGESYAGNTGYLVDKSRNTVHRFLAKDGAEIRFNRNSENLLWIVTNDNKLALFRPEDFKRINQPKGSHTFELDVVDKEIDSEAEVREILYF